ncbi:MAG: ribose ABC transporter permease [Verrucomicrobia bacterium]|nr:ribose ABC transporter permease [Verrucomicrobiota bacterium]
MTRPASREFLARFQSLLALVVMAVVLSLLSDKFLTTDNGWNILRQISVNLCLSVGLTLVIVSGGIDLSVGATLGLAGAVAAGLFKSGLPLPVLGVRLDFTLTGAIVAAIVVGLALGAVNGLAVTALRLPPFIATLGMLSIGRGLTMLWTGGFPITDLGPRFGYLGTGAPLGVPMPVWIVATLAGWFALVARHSVFGRHVYAVGSNELTARLAGLAVARIRFSVYALAGALAGVAGLLVTARLDSAQPTAGLGYELDAIAAVVIGGTSLSGGRGTIGGTVLGCLIIGVLNNGLFLLNVSPFWQQVIKGAVILLAVAIDKLNASSRDTT